MRDAGGLDWAMIVATMMMDIEFIASSIQASSFSSQVITSPSSSDSVATPLSPTSSAALLHDRWKEMLQDSKCTAYQQLLDAISDVLS